MIIDMHTVDTKSRFIELRAKGWSLARIAKAIDVSQRTLVDWNRQHRAELQALRAVEVEALEEKLLASHEHELACLARSLEKIENVLSERKFDYEPARDLFHMAALVRSEIRKKRLEPPFSGAADPAAPGSAAL
jgi:transposase